MNATTRDVEIAVKILDASAFSHSSCLRFCFLFPEKFDTFSPSEKTPLRAVVVTCTASPSQGWRNEEEVGKW
jgi:hypothetical protein